MSVWDNYSGGISLPPGTPNIEILPNATGAFVEVNGQAVHSGTYQECHRYVQNTYRLTSTMMMPIFAAYEARLPKQPETAEAPPEQAATGGQNKYRKPDK